MNSQIIHGQMGKWDARFRFLAALPVMAQWGAPILANASNRVKGAETANIGSLDQF
jgi:hypothetical protein